jgi:DNA-binding NarL/FixJ family response regulator
MKVFVVEDSAALCKRIVRLVKEVKNTSVVGTAKMAAGALRGIEKYRPDVVILDIQLLYGDGLSVLKQVKKMSSATRVIMLTNFSSHQYRTQAEYYGAEAFLDKSNDFLQIPFLLEAWHSPSDVAIH